jgi:hypothetical protein
MCKPARGQILSPRLGDVVESGGKGLSYWPVSLLSLAGRYNSPMPESIDYIPPVRD